MAFNIKNYLYFAYVSLFKGGDIKQRLSPKRIAWLIFFYTVFPLLELINRVGFLLDEILFPSYRQQTIQAPVFIVGNPRSGTTFLHRLLAKDKRTFTWMRMWEMFVAPSITQRKMMSIAKALDHRLGDPLHHWLIAQQQRWQQEVIMHEIDLQAPEEDEYLLLHIWSTIMVWMYAGFLDEMGPWMRFDTALSEKEKQRVMRFYTKCLQRHQYAHDSSAKHYLSKNPSFSPKIDALYKTFPDAKIIYLVRSPLNVVPSLISTMRYQWHVLGEPVKDRHGYPNILDLTEHWYTYPLEQLGHLPPKNTIIINFNDLVRDPDRTVRTIYERFGLEISPVFAEILQEATIQSRAYQSRHHYHLEDMGLTREQILTRFAPIFRRFDFATQASQTAAPSHTAQSAEPAQSKTHGKRRKPRNLGLSTPHD